MDIVIAGAGAIGMLIGSYLCEAGMKVGFLVRKEEAARQIRENGIQRIVNGKTGTFNVEAFSDPNKLPYNVPWIVAVKYAGIKPILKLLMEKEMVHPILFVQNGMAHVEDARKSGLPELYFATVEHGAERLDVRTCSHNGVGQLKIAASKNGGIGFDFMEQAASPNFPIDYHHSADEIILRKTLINCMINPLTAMLQVRNGELLENPHCKTILLQLYEEMNNGIAEMPDILPLEDLLTVCEKTRMNHSSMLKDRMNVNVMEIDTIVTPILRLAKNNGKTLPTLALLEQMLHAINGRG